MIYPGVSRLSDLSPMIRPDSDRRPPSPSWVQVYRELVERATLFSIVWETGSPLKSTHLPKYSQYS